MKKNDNDPTALLRLDGVAVATLNTINLRGEIDKRVRRVFKMCEDADDGVKALANAAIKDYVDSQRAVFQSKGLNPDRALKEAIVGYEENGKTRWRIVPRGTTLEEIDNGRDGGDHSLSIAASKGYSDRVGLGRDMCRGKFNDGHMLINEASCSVDASEVVPFAIW